MNVLLKILDRFQWMFALMKVDYGQLRSIIAIKLTMDNRRQLVAYRKKENKEPRNVFAITVAFYALFGTFMALGMFSIKAFMPAMILYFSYITVMVAMTLITDFSSVLLDTSDNTIILPRPVDGRTLFIARATHILLYLSQLAAGLSIAPTILTFYMYGPLVGVLFIVGTILSVITALFITHAIYLLIMHFSSEEKLKNMINYFQIVMAVFIVGGYQILPRVLMRMDLNTYTFEWTWWKYLIPPVWTAGALETFAYNLWDAPHALLIVIALVIPIAGSYLVNRYLTPVFNRKLGVMGGATETQPIKSDKVRKQSFVSKISTYVANAGFERGAFETVYRILGRDRKLKLKVYPAYGFVPIFGMIFIFGNNRNLTETWEMLPTTQYHLLLIYITFMIVQTALTEISYTDDFKASWVYFSAPIDKPGGILLGTMKAIIIRLFLPGYFVVSIFIFFIWGLKVWDDVLFGLLNNFLMVLGLAQINKKCLPFSLAPNMRNQTGNFVRSMLSFIMLATLGFGHYLFTKVDIVMLVAIPLQLIAIYIMARIYRETPWKEITL
jgi:ABC-2 type transport system permease protein